MARAREGAIAGLRRIKVKYLLLITILFSFLKAECYPIEKYKNEITVIEKGTIVCQQTQDSNKSLCIETDIVQQKKEGSLPYQSFCINGEKIASGYPTLNMYEKNVSSYSNNIKINAHYIMVEMGNKLFLYNIKQKKIDLLNIENIKKYYSLSDNQFLIEFYSKKTRSYDILIYNTDGSSNKVITTPYDDYVRNIDYNNNFILDQIPIFNSKRRSATDTSEIIKEAKEVRLPYSHQGSYIIDKHLNIVSYKETNSTKASYPTLDKLQRGFVHGKLSIVILAFSLFSILITTKFLHSIASSFRLPTITTFFMLAYVVFVYIGAVALNVVYFQYEFNTHLYERKDLLLNIWIYTTIGLYLIPLGAYIAKKVLVRNRDFSIDTFFSKDINISFNNKRLFLSMLFLFFLSIVVLFVYFSKLELIPIFGIFSYLTPEQLNVLRSNSGNNFSGHLYRYVTFYQDIPLLLLLVSFILKDKGTNWKMLFYGLLIYNIFVSIMDLSKAPLVNLLLVLLITYFFIKKQIDWKKLFFLSLISFILLIIMYIEFMGISKDGLLSTLVSPFHRAFIGSISPLFWWQLYIEQHGLLQGATMPNPHHILPFEHIKISVAVMDFAHAELRDMHIVGSMPVVFFAEWFANFGWGAAIASMLLFGMLLFGVDYIFISQMLKNKSAILLGLYIYVMYHFKSYSTTSISGIITDTHLWIPIIVAILLFVTTKNIQRGIK